MKIKKPGKVLKERNMKKLFRRNQIIITTLAIMIAAAGYLNYAGKKELEASMDPAAYEAGVMEISDEDLLMENQAASYNFSGEIEEAESVAASSRLAVRYWGELLRNSRGGSISGSRTAACRDRKLG